MPMIDYREHIWNEIWTLCWEMESIKSMSDVYAELMKSDLDWHDKRYMCHTKLSAYGRKRCCKPREKVDIFSIASSIGKHWENTFGGKTLEIKYILSEKTYIRGNIGE